jgi:hypothetical protein
MKLKTTLIAAFSAAAMATSHAFNIDFNAISITPPTIGQNESFTVTVDNYGTVTFTNITPNTASSIAIGNNFLDNEGNNVYSLELESETFTDAPIEAEIIMVTFNDAEVTNAQAVFAGNSANPFDVGIFIQGGSGDDPFEGPLDGDYYAATIGAPGSDGVGLQSISWDVVPEPSSAALGALGMSMILLRRRRA